MTGAKEEVTKDSLLPLDSVGLLFTLVLKPSNKLSCTVKASL